MRSNHKILITFSQLKVLNCVTQLLLISRVQDYITLARSNKLLRNSLARGGGMLRLNRTMQKRDQKGAALDLARLFTASVAQACPFLRKRTS